MNRLIDAFLELPTWQGMALIAVFVATHTTACLAGLSLVTHHWSRSR